MLFLLYHSAAPRIRNGSAVGNMLLRRSQRGAADLQERAETRRSFAAISRRNPGINTTHTIYDPGWCICMHVLVHK
jgi:hypothetical protein